MRNTCSEEEKGQRGEIVKSLNKRFDLFEDLIDIVLQVGDYYFFLPPLIIILLIIVVTKVFLWEKA